MLCLCLQSSITLLISLTLRAPFTTLLLPPAVSPAPAAAYVSNLNLTLTSPRWRWLLCVVTVLPLSSLPRARCLSLPAPCHLSRPVPHHPSSAVPTVAPVCAYELPRRVSPLIDLAISQCIFHNRSCNCGIKSLKLGFASAKLMVGGIVLFGASK
ncbi:hypothetical protein PIB30_016524 [Stylosanthes scabra]|uniref:Secreted protein n=1 Tax=Stylosanthes scabra TaxID=79078 RepID=A0ABU6Q762_9FABA|nr:hypothetical protein [Stylosanthes scabra]